MKESNKTQTFAEVLKSMLLEQKITRPRFKLSLPADEIELLITSAYQAEVEYRGRRFIDDEPTKRHVRQFLDALTVDNSKSGIILCGICGNGKTTLLYAFQNAINWLTKEGLMRSAGIRIADAREINTSYKTFKEFNTLRTAEILGIEDMGKEPAEVLDYGNVGTPIAELLEYRYDKQLFTVITTNLTPKQIRKKYGERIADRFNEMMNVIVFENRSYRI